MRSTIRFPVQKTTYLLALALYMVSSTLLIGVQWRFQVWYLYQLCQLAAMVLLAICAARGMRIRPDRYFISAVAIFGLVMVAAWHTQEYKLLFPAAFMLCARRIRYQDILHVMYRVNAACLAVIVAARVIGLTETIYLQFPYGLADSMGMAHPNNFAGLAATVLLLWCWRNQNRHLLMITAVCLISTVAVYIVAMSRTSLVVMAACWVLLLMYRALARMRSLWLIRMAKVGIFVVMGVALGMMIYSADILQNWGASSFLSRFTSAMSLYERYGLHLFSEPIELIGTQEARALGVAAVVVDSGYLYLLICQGLVMTLLFVMSQVRIAFVLSKRRQYVLLLMMSLMLLSGLMEQTVLMPQFNFTLLAMVSLVETDHGLYSRKEMSGEVEESRPKSVS